jgi:hypothetical protein
MRYDLTDFSSLARASNDGGIVRPSAFAVPTLMTSSKLSGGSGWQLAGAGTLEDLVGKDSSNWNQPALEPVLFQLVSESVSAVRMAWTAIAAMTPVRKSPKIPIPIASARASACRYDVAITDREAGDEGEIHCVPHRPALDKANHQAQGNLNRQNCRQHRPCQMYGVAKGQEKAPPHGLWYRPVHM